MQKKDDEIIYSPLYCSKFDQDLVSYYDCQGCKFGKEQNGFISCRYCQRKLEPKVKSIILKDYKPDYVKALASKKSITLNRGGGLGDIIRLTPTIKELKRRLPKLKINLRCDSEYLPIFYGNPFIDHLYSYEDKVSGDEENVVLDFNKGFRLEDHSVQGIAKRLHLKLTDYQILYYIRKEEIQWAKDRLAKLVSANTLKVGISAMASSPEKCPSLEFWQEFYYCLRASFPQQTQLFFFGDKKPDMPPMGKSVLLFGNPIRKTAALMSLMDLFIGADSGLLYLAMGLNLKILGLFGLTPGESIKYEKFDFIDKRKEVCKQYCYGKPVCKEIPGKCIQAIKPEDVVYKVGRILGLRKTSVKSGHFRSINVLFTRGGLGDTLTITPGLEQLKKRFPLSKLTVVLASEENEKILKNNPCIDTIIVTNNPARFSSTADLTFDITDYPADYEARFVPRIKKSRIELFSEAMGNDKLESATPCFYPTEEELKWAKYMANVLKHRILVAIQPRSGEAYKDWPVPYWEELISLVNSYFPQSLILNFDPELQFENTFLIREDIRKVVTFLQFCDLVICPDSLFLHIAGMWHIKTVAIFGPSGYRAGYENVSLCQRIDLPCCPCWRNANMKCNPLPGKQRGTEGQDISQCMLDLTPEMVFDKVKPILRELEYGSKRSSYSSWGERATSAGSSSKTRYSA